MKKEKIVIGVTALIFIILIFGSRFSSEKNKFASWRSWFLYAKNNLGNDNSKNYACHNYAHNLLIGVETNSIFMTEGGDNQVFSLLYYSYVENKRPDIDFYDQKGNIFPRLYGDLLNTSYIELDIIRAIRDYQLYSTGRPVYLTWKRSNAEKLSLSYIQLLRSQLIAKMKSYGFQQAESYVNRKFRVNTLEELKVTASIMIKKSIFNLKFRNGQDITDSHFVDLGPWYLKRYGIIYKVTPVRYAIVDAAELYGKLSLAEVVGYIKSAEKITLTVAELQRYIDELVDEGLILFKNDQVVFQKQQADPFDTVSVEDYAKNYYQETMDIPEAKYWDLLTRQIYDVYFDNKLKNIAEKVKYLNTVDSSFLPEGTDVKAEVEKYDEEKFKILSRFLSFGYDNTLTHQVVAQQYVYRNDMAKGIEVLQNVPNISWDYIPALSQISRLLFQMSLTIPEDEREDHKLRIERHLDFTEQRLYKIFKILRPGQDYEKTKYYQELGFLRNQLSSLYKPQPQFQPQIVKPVQPKKDN